MLTTKVKLCDARRSTSRLIGTLAAGALGLIASASCGSQGAGRSGSPGTDGSSGGGGAAGATASGQGGAGGSTNPGGAAGTSGAGAGAPPTPVDGPNGHAFDQRTGALNVDYASYLSKHDVVYEKPNSDPVRGLTIGNGRVGAMVWTEQGLTLQVSNVDASPQAAFSCGLVNFDTSPGLNTGASGYEQRLELHDGVLRTTYGEEVTVTIVGAPDSEILGIHVEDHRATAAAATLELRLWDVSTLGNSGNVANLDTWKTVSLYSEQFSAGLSRGQADPQNFGYTLAASAQGVSFTTEELAGNGVRLNVAGAAEYTLWLTCASRYNAASNDSLARARSSLAAVESEGYDAVLDRNERFWNDFWSRSFIQYSNDAGDADYLENIYYLATYMIASGGYGTHPFHFINGVYRATFDQTKWSNAYWYWNQRDVYHSFLASNHADLVNGFNRMYSRNLERLLEDTQTRYGVAGIWVPETMGWNGDPSGTVYSDFTNKIYSTGAEAAHNMYLQYRYTGDEDYLSQTAYPFIREAAKFYQGMLSFDAESGKYVMELSHAHETYWDVQNAITDLVAVRVLFPIAIEVSEQLGVDASLRAEWQSLLDQLAPYPATETEYLPHQPPIAETHNGENVACELIWPYGVTGLGAPDYERALSTWQARPFPYWNVWSNDAIQAARLGLGDEAFAGMKVMLQKFQSFENGMTDNTNGVFEYLGVHLSVMNESLLHSHGEALRVLPALPGDASLVTRFSLAAKGGFVVSAEREVGEVKYVGLKSLLGNPVDMVSPWPGEAVQVRRATDGAVLTTSSDAGLRFATEAGGVYVVERVAKPLASYSYSHIEGQRNTGAKYLAGTTCSLGIDAVAPNSGRYEAEDALLIACSESGDSAASGLAQVTGISLGASVAFSGVRAGSELRIVYCTQNEPGKLSLYVNGGEQLDVTFPSTSSWGGTFGEVTVSLDIPEGATLTLQNDAGDAGANLDYIEIH